MARTTAVARKADPNDARSRATKIPRTSPFTSYVGINVRCNELTCTNLSIRRKYCDEAVEILKQRLTEKLAADKVNEIRHLRIATPDHNNELLDFFRSFALPISIIEVESSVKCAERDNWVVKVLSFEQLDSVKIRLSEIQKSNRDAVRSIIDRAQTHEKASIELFDYDLPASPRHHHVDTNIITDEYLLQVAKTMKKKIELDISSTLLTVEGVLAVYDAIAERPDAARLRFQVATNAHQLKDAILEKWGLKKTVDRRFKDTNDYRTTPSEYKEYKMYNEGYENLCIFDGKMRYLFPTEMVIDGLSGCCRPHRFAVERVIDEKTQLNLERGWFEVKYN